MNLSRTTMPNQYKPLEQVRPLIERYWQEGLNDHEIVKRVREHFDTTTYTLSIASLKRMRKAWGLKSTRQQKHTVASIAPAVEQIRARAPKMGARQMVVRLREDYMIKAPETLVAACLKSIPPSQDTTQEAAVARLADIVRPADDQIHALALSASPAI
ncbi:hypothetical protein B0H21DRAFT_310604 [Amylocystis lapponica]|nr:hypothetical protein B0H21DRAFT_310604 [Amylocystis lapponica]